MYILEIRDLHTKKTLKQEAGSAKGGFTTVCCMPNTKPVIDNVETVEYVINKSKKVGLTNVLPVGAVTKNMAGWKLQTLAS